LALAVPLSRFTSRVGGGSAFYVDHMRDTSVLHVRALLGAGVHFVFCAFLGGMVLGLTVADVITTSSEAPPPWWLSAMHRFLVILNAPMAGFFGLWQDTRPMRLPLLLLAEGWSVVLGYLIALAWWWAEKVTGRRHLHEPGKV